MTGTTPTRFRVHHFAELKARHEPITMLTCYDTLHARLFDTAGIETLLVGDSYGNTMLGYPSTIPVTLEEMVIATRAVARGARRAFIVGDLPFGSYEESEAQAVRSSIALIKAGAHAVKLEGGERQAHTIRAITAAGVSVVGHIGFTPQSEAKLGGPRVQGRGEEGATRLIDDAAAVQEAGAIAVVLEMVPAKLAAKITEILEIPTIGIGAGAGTDGQVLVWTDMAGMTEWTPSFSQQFGQIGKALTQAATDYKNAVKSGEFPAEKHSF
ncbi:MAG: 3-methyl-2-oxobutanoate hydroxymethyltransferase [Ancrocorticia sp.]|jgi:3-methyl-2-oxobutanoate hydroxymethyltransferase|nr:3-methyl-2-oxobutanoate hydroxymethyltransferase [Ancrocorticia sp.]MCI2194144.1 3-methyl-2-oxobutanoate hydroxymethyltransferase [Ancrocorticia sp.]MCI2199094.1 3-methyl-2-oxobutanoate hydroxymethyltransferase [Ancrocorticia sp.]